MAVQNITYDNKTTGDQWLATEATQVKTVVNNNATETSTNTTNISTNTASISTNASNISSNTTAIAGKANTTHTHVKADITDFSDSDYATASHNHDSDYQALSEKGSANGYASLNASGKVPSSELDLSAYEQTTNKGANNGYASLNASGKVPASELDLTSYQATSEKASANGYASLDGNTKIPFAQIPSVDEDDMASDSNALVPTQQSVKSYVDNYKFDLNPTIRFIAQDTAVADGDSFDWHIPEKLDGYNLYSAKHTVDSAGTGSSTTLDVRHVGRSSSMLNAVSSLAAGSTTVKSTNVNTSQDNVAEDDVIRFVINFPGTMTTDPEGLTIELMFKYP